MIDTGSNITVISSNVFNLRLTDRAYRDTSHSYECRRISRDIYFLVYSVSNYPLGDSTRLDEALIRNTTGWKRLLGSKSFLTVVDLKAHARECEFIFATHTRCPPQLLMIIDLDGAVRDDIFNKSCKIRDR